MFTLCVGCISEAAQGGGFAWAAEDGHAVVAFDETDGAGTDDGGGADNNGGTDEGTDDGAGDDGAGGGTDSDGAGGGADNGTVDGSVEWTSNPYDADRIATLQQNLIGRFSKGGDYASMGTGSENAAVALAALGLGESLDVDAILDNFSNYESTYGYAMGAGQYAKFIIMLTAAGIDCTAVEIDGQSHDLISEMEALVSANALDIWSAVWILPVYGSYGYTQAAGMTEEELVSFILAAQSDGGLFGSAEWASYDTQTTAQAILALLPYRADTGGADAEDDVVSTAIDKAQQALLAAQLPDGGFYYASSDETAGNLDATAEIVAALVALGYDVAAADFTTQNGSSPLGFILSQADDSLEGILADYSPEMSSAAALLALAAYEGYQNADGAYYVYTVKAADTGDGSDGDGSDGADDGTADTSGGSDNDGTAADTSSGSSSASGGTSSGTSSGSSSNTSSGSSSTGSSSTLAKTNDPCASWMYAAMFCAFAAAIGMTASYRRLRQLRRGVYTSVTQDGDRATIR